VTCTEIQQNAEQAMYLGADTGNTAAWFTLAGALGGVLLTSVVALVTAFLNHRWQSQTTGQQRLEEHIKQLRQERREAYAHYWSTWNRFNHELRALRDEVQKFRELLDPRAQLAEKAPEVVERAWTAEVEWREAADALLLIAGHGVVQEALVHIDVTQERLDAAWRGEWNPGGDAYRGLNQAMRRELLGLPQVEP
jgi:hypothetical protein